ncbi:MAG: hypothetical protein IPP66_03440 [Anaerolineales bacterium]|nr:hypothetical protein [Anaerolineales bacterium]
MNTNEQGSNKNNKWMWIGLGAAALLCCCAVIVAVLVFRQMGKTIQEGVKTDPASASKAAHEIVDYTLPEGYQEQMTMNFMIYTFVMITPTSNATNEPIIMLAQFQAGVDEKQMEQQIRQSFEQQSGRRGMTLELKEVKQMTIRGEERQVAIYEGTDSNGTSMRQLVTSFPGKNGTAMLIVMGSPSNWDDDKIDKFIESIQ